MQRWIGPLRQHLNGAIRQEGRRVILSDDAVNLLRQIRQLRDDGMSFSEAVAKVLETETTGTSINKRATLQHAETTARQRVRQCGVVEVVVAVSCAIGAASLVAIAVAAWIK